MERRLREKQDADENASKRWYAGSQLKVVLVPSQSKGSKEFFAIIERMPCELLEGASRKIISQTKAVKS